MHWKRDVQLLLLFAHLSGVILVAGMSEVWVELRAPRFVVHHHSAVLRCDHNVDPESLYKVVFFKNGQRIMKFVRGRDPPFELYNITGTEINLIKLSPTSITLERLDFSASGPYACEIALETPLYSKVSKIHELNVIVRQKYRPKIKIKHKKLSSNDHLEATCQSAPAHPAPHLTWFINNNKILTALRFYACGCYQQPVGLQWGCSMSQKSVSRVIRAVTSAINEKLLRKYIKFPMTQGERHAAKQKFRNAPQPFPGVIGAIDCTHIKILAPKTNEESYVSGHHEGHSLNVQAVDESLTIPYGTMKVHRHHHGIPLSMTNTSLHFPLTNLQLFPNQTVEITCLSTIPSYASMAEGFADVQNSTVTVNVVRIEPAPTQLPVKIVSSQLNISARCHVESTLVVLVIFVCHIYS